MDHDRSSLSSGGEAPDDEEEDERPKERQRRKKTSSASYRYYDQMRGHSSGLGDAKNHHDNYAQETEYDWLFDYLYSVFKAPSWEKPLQEFIDENCTVFDNDDENKLAYTELHDVSSENRRSIRLFLSGPQCVLLNSRHLGTFNCRSSEV
jgi:hypothetical protein